MLVEAHGPEGHDLPLGVGVVVGEELQLGLEVLDVLVGVALGKLGREFESVGLEALLELFEGDQPVGAGACGGLLIDHVLASGSSPWAIASSRVRVTTRSRASVSSSAGKA